MGNWTEELFVFALGWLLGSSAVWLHFRVSKLIRSREEWYKATGRNKDGRL